jgi:hypothetical protein
MAGWRNAAMAEAATRKTAKRTVRTMFRFAARLCPVDIHDYGKLGPGVGATGLASG